MKKENQKLKTIRCKQCKKTISFPKPLPGKLYFCPLCGATLPPTLKLILSYLSFIQLNKKLAKVKTLIEKDEIIEAARTSLIILEQEVRNIARLKDLSGATLMAKAFSFDYNTKIKRMVRPPIIQINTLKTKLERNEQEGIQFIAMGLLKGARNILVHSYGFVQMFNCLHIIVMVDFLFNHIYAETKMSDHIR